MWESHSTLTKLTFTQDEKMKEFMLSNNHEKFKIPFYEFEEFEKVALDEYTAVVLMTHDYNWDKTILTKVIDQDIPYLGMLGPKKRMVKMQDDLSLDDLDEKVHFHSPVGLDIGAESPEEIALAIAAEIVAVFRNKSGKSLKFKKGVIHD